MSVHAALRDFYRLRTQEKVSKKLLLKLLEKNWQIEGYSSSRYEREMWQRGVTYLSDYFAKEYSPKTKTLLTEQPFIVSLQSQGKRLKIGGQIDRIDDLVGAKSKLSIIKPVDFRVSAKLTQVCNYLFMHLQRLRFPNHHFT